MGADAAIVFLSAHMFTSSESILSFAQSWNLLSSIRMYRNRGDRGDVPLAGALAVGPWAGVPDTLVRHDCGSNVDDEGGVV